MWTTTSAIPAIRWRSSSSSSPASRWASVSDSPASTAERQEQHAAGLRGEQPHPLGLGAGALAHEPLDLASGRARLRRRRSGAPRRAAARAARGASGRRPRRALGGSRARPARRSRARWRRSRSAGNFRCSETLPVSRCSKMVMSWASLTSGSDSAIASTRSRRSRPRARGSTWTTTSLPGSAASTACSTRSAARWPSTTRLPGGHAHDHVGEVASGRLAQPQPAELDVLAHARRSPARRPRGASAGVRSISTLAFTAISRSGGGQDDRGDDQGGDRVGLAEARAHGQQPGQDGQRAGHVGREVEGVRAQRGAVVAPRRDQRDARCG